MAHNLHFDSRSGQHAFFCVGDRMAAWHKLGQRTGNAVTWSDAVEAARLNWQVLKRPVYRTDGTALPAFEMYRDDTQAHLGIVGDQFKAIQNRDCFAFVDSIIGESDGAHYESAGALGNGERIWCLARIPGADFEIGAGDKHQSYLLFANGHDGSLSGLAKITSVRVVCQNTLTAAISCDGKGETKFRHTRNVAGRMNAAQSFMGSAVEGIAGLQERLNVLADRKVQRESLNRIMDRLFPNKQREISTRTKNTIADVLGCYESNDRNAFPETRGSAYNLLNAIAEYTDHVRGVRVTTKRTGIGEDALRAEGALFGSGAILKENALEIIMEETVGAPGMMRERIIVQAPSRPMARIGTDGGDLFGRLGEMIDFS